MEIRPFQCISARLFLPPYAIDISLIGCGHQVRIRREPTPMADPERPGRWPLIIICLLGKPLAGVPIRR